jgi:Ca2+-binding EF-hand superfamily protein
MNKLFGFLLFVIATHAIHSQKLLAQPPWGGGPPPWGGGGGPPMGGSEGFRSWGDRGRDGGSSFGGFDPSMFLGRMDRNGNGSIDPDEMEGPARFMIERMARSNPKIDMSKPIPLSAISEAFQAMRSGGSSWGGSSWGGSSWGSSSSSTDDSVNVEKVLVPGFGIKKEKAPVPGFGSLSKQESIRVEEQDLREADDRMQRYDRNRDGVLDEAEIRDGRWSDSPMVYDKNGDGKLTREELAVRYAKRRMSSSNDSSSYPQRDSRDSSRDGRDRDRSGSGGNDRGNKDEKKEASNPYEKTASYRLFDKEGNAKKPTGLPEWFTRNDVNNDNQVSMQEFIKKLTNDAIEDFNRFDSNQDGFITAKECLAAAKKGYIPGSLGSVASSSSSSSPSSGSSGESKPADSKPTASTASAPSAAGAPPMDARMKEWVAGRLKRYDKDGNGKLDPEELKAYDGKVDFAAIDLNKDGLVDVDEMYAERMKKK